MPPSCTLREWFTTHRSGVSMLGGGAAPEGNHLFIGLHHPPGADTTRCKRDANLQGWNACSTCHDGLLAVVTSASQGAVLSGAVPPETRHHSRVVVVSVEYSSRTLPRCWQLCRKCTLTPPCKHCASWSRSRSETSRGTRKKLQRRKTGHPPDTLHPICRRLRGVQQYMGRHTTMQRGYPGMVERHGARTERRQNTVRPHPRAQGGV